MTRQAVVYIGLIALVVGLLGGFAIGWRVYDQPAPSAAHYAPPAAHNDGSITLEQKPDSVKTPLTAIPKGDRATRIVRLTVRDTVRTVICVRDTVVECPPCPEIPIDLTLSAGKGGTHVTAKSGAGAVVSGTDIPLTATIERAHKWRVGLAGDPAGLRVGAFGMRDLGPFCVGAVATYWPEHGAGAVVMAGVRF
jgi:hypothetical protein